MRLPCSVVATLAHIPTAMWKGFLLSAPHLPRYLLLFVWFLIAILSGVRQDLDCSLDSSFPNEPKEVGFSVIYWPTVLIHLKSACSFALLLCILYFLRCSVFYVVDIDPL